MGCDSRESICLIACEASGSIAGMGKGAVTYVLIGCMYTVLTCYSNPSIFFSVSATLKIKPRASHLRQALYHELHAIYAHVYASIYIFTSCEHLIIIFSTISPLISYKKEVFFNKKNLT